MKIKKEVTVGVVEKVREYYVSKTKLGGLIKVDVLEHDVRFGDEIHIYYKEVGKYDRVYVNGIEFEPKEVING